MTAWTCFLWVTFAYQTGESVQSAEGAKKAPIQKVVVGSCARQDRPAPVWDAMDQAKPDAVILLGDNIYGDTRDPEILRSKYQRLVDNPSFKRLRQGRPLMATWDDHDYGENDAGEEYPLKDQSKKIFLEFLGAGEADPRSSRPGIHQSWIMGPPGKRVQFILLDTRWNRTPLAKKEGRKGEYAPSDDPKATFLGEDQWAWLEKELAREAEIRLICSSIQVIPEEHPFEKWANFPKERERLLALLQKTNANGVVLLSGDRHLGEISCLSSRSGAVGYPLFELTASGINQGSPKFRVVEPNRHRFAAMPWGNHFGVVRMDWEKPDPEIRLELRDDAGEIVVSSRFSLSNLQRKGPSLPPTVLKEGEIDPAGVASRLGQSVRMRFRVASTGKAKDQSRIFLNTHDDFRDKENVTIVLDMRALGAALAEKGIKDPAGAFAGKEFVAVGKVELFRESPQIVIDNLDNLISEK